MLAILNTLFYALFILSMGYYFMTNLQWYSYKLTRVLFHHTKIWWHFVYFLIPFALYSFVDALSPYAFVIAILYLGLILHWHRGLDKPLVFTGRVKRFVFALILFALFIAISFHYYAVILPIFLAYFISIFIEKMLFHGFQTQAQKKLDAMSDMKVIGITASYGKTSIKNYVTHLLQAKYNTYATPRSVNTLGGVMIDINNDLPSDTEVYVVEMGARGEGDIAQISTFVNPHYAIVGKIGPAHIEYFRTIENIRNTKMEILKSDRLDTAWIHQSANVKTEANVHTFGDLEGLDMRSNTPAPTFVIEDVKATLDSTSFRLKGVSYSAKILGAFNAMNLAVSVLVAKELGLTDTQIQSQLSTLAPVAHRLQRIDAGGKVILDDSFNGNIDGMMSAFDLASTHQGRKVVITPGLVEVDESYNIQVAQRVNEVFDIVIVSGELNYATFKKYIDADKLIKLPSKDKMQEILIEHTQAGDLILFANDAPSFI
ncbi:MAG: UDP-N-acetylmuramoyl-tripeptide--D-alanyl-D-alanine ligase [Sulfurovum sp.]|nr:UDP-N-acetylmuramoyl-tripeptide--D-alanyl-D-alanine ligase [Sulfurovum sp.]